MSLAPVCRDTCPIRSIFQQITCVAKRRATLAGIISVIGASLSPRTLHNVGWKAAVQGMLLWVFISVVSLLLILYGHAG